MPANVLSLGDTFGQSAPIATAGYTGETRVSDRHARYMEAVLRGSVFYAANNAVQALSVASSTYTGLAVANPAGSGKNLVIIDIAFGLDALQTGFSAIAIGTAVTVALTAGASTGPTNCLIGAGTGSVAKAGASATLGAAPVIARILAGAQWVTTGTTSNIQLVKDELAGLITLTPGQLVCIEAITTAVSGLAHITWEEVSINS